MATFEEDISSAVVRAIESEIDKMVLLLEEEAVEKIHDYIRRIVANAALTASSYYSMERIGNVLRIEVKVDAQP